MSAPSAIAVRTNAVTVTVSSRYPVTGKAGALDWSLDREGTLTVSGVGAMPDYAVPPHTDTRADGEAAPWSAYAAEIKVVVVVEGVTNVGAGAFAGLTVLVKVTLPDSVASIGDGAFAGCSVLVEINIPTGTAIGDGAFDGCDKLPEITIPVTDVTVEPETLTLTEGDTETLIATVSPANATNRTVTWSSDKPAIATVDAATGKVTTIAAGTATITATVDGKTASCAVTVEAKTPPDTFNVLEHIPNPAFRAYIESRMTELDTNQDGLLSREEAAVDIVSFNLDSGYIASLEGLEYFTGLLTLLCPNNGLTSLDVSKNTALTILGCSMNPGNGEGSFPVTAWFDNDNVPSGFTTGGWMYDANTNVTPVYRKRTL